MTEAKKVSVQEMKSRGYCIDKSAAEAYCEAIRSKPKTEAINTLKPVGKSAPGSPVKIDAVSRPVRKLKVAAYCRVIKGYPYRTMELLTRKEFWIGLE